MRRITMKIKMIIASLMLAATMFAQTAPAAAPAQCKGKECASCCKDKCADCCKGAKCAACEKKEASMKCKCAAHCDRKAAQKAN